MNSNVIHGAAVILLSLALPAFAEEPEGHVTAPAPEAPAPAAPAAPVNVHPFAALAGTWTGGGTIDLTNEIHERLRCRANYTYGKANNSLALSIRCASDNYKFELSSNVVERGGQFSGQWSETGYGVSGTISGRVNGQHISAVASGDNFNATLAVSTTGNKQSVTITPKATYIIKVQIGLGRASTARS
jgi:hypothetical protein